MTTIGSRLKRLREGRNLTVRQLAEELETHRKTIYTWEHDHFVPGAGNLVRICEFFGVSVDYILYGTVSGGDRTASESPKNPPGGTAQIMKRFNALPAQQQKQAIEYLELTYSTTNIKDD